MTWHFGGPEEHRELQRWPVLPYYLWVFRPEAESPLGHVADIHKGGIRLVSEKRVAAEKDYSLSMRLPLAGARQEQISLEARSIWSHINPEANNYETGFRITGTTPTAIQRIENLVRDVQRLEAQLRERQAALQVALERYEAALDKLGRAMVYPEQILNVLKARDAVQEALRDIDIDPGDKLIRIVQLDGRLKKEAKRFAQAAELADWRASLRPLPEAWWWSLEHGFGASWRALSLLSLTAALSLLVNISSRFLGGKPDEIGAFAVIMPSVFTLMTAKSTLTEAGQKGIERLLERWKIRRYHWHKARFLMTTLLLLFILVIYSTLPQVAGYYRDRGFDNYQANNLATAKSDYHRALALDQNDGLTHYYLGLLSEDLQDLNAARAEYQMAATICSERKACSVSYNNLARLYILDNNYDAAVFHLKLHLRPKAKGIVELNYYYYKNLGWVRFKQDRLADAEAQLREAIELADNAKLAQQSRAAAHCLLAQVLDERGSGAQEATIQWGKCLDYSSGLLPEEDKWIHMARKRLTP